VGDVHTRVAGSVARTEATGHEEARAGGDGGPGEKEEDKGHVIIVGRRR
jgi:hypothetical protein